EDLMIKFGLDLKKLNRRINALERKIIPGIEVDIKKIKDVLEENERESFSRLKKIKELINNST
ncbi:MAG: V-type ATP synthase subunit D, partial [Candidatus Lokiarchaeota archaeon]|nr:V-type ATP synthase subunit D [Candidatus Lokiarchaeota archaeon]